MQTLEQVRAQNNHNAALHWRKAVDMMKSNVDMWDIMTVFPQAGVDDKELFENLNKLEAWCNSVLD